MNITSGVLGRAPTFDLNHWGGAGHTTITRNGIAGPLMTLSGTSTTSATGGYKGIRIGYGIAGGGGSVTIDLGTTGYLFGGGGSYTSLVAQGACDFTLRGIGQAGYGLLSASNALKTISFAGGGSLYIGPPTGGGTHATTASGYGFVDVTTFTLPASNIPLSITIEHAAPNAVTTWNMRQALNVNTQSAVDIRRTGGTSSALVTPSITMSAGAVRFAVDHKPLATSTNAAVSLTAATRELSVPEGAAFNIYARQGVLQPMTALTGNLAVMGTMHVQHAQTASGSGDVRYAALEVGGALAVGGDLTVEQKPDPGVGGNVTGSSGIMVGGTATISGTLTIDKQSNSDGVCLQSANIHVNGGTVIATQSTSDGGTVLDVGSTGTFRATSGARVMVTKDRRPLGGAIVCGVLDIQAGAEVTIDQPGTLAIYQAGGSDGLHSNGPLTVSGTLAIQYGENATGYVLYGGSIAVKTGGRIQIVQTAGEETIQTPAALTVENGGAVDVQINRTADTGAIVLACGILTVNQGGALAIANPAGAEYVQKGLVVNVTNYAIVNGTMTVDQRCYNTGGIMKVDQKLTVGPQGVMRTDTYRDESAVGQVRALQVEVQGGGSAVGGLLDVRTRTTNAMGTVTPGIKVDYTVTVAENAKVNVDCQGQIAGGPAIMGDTLDNRGTVNVTHFTSGQGEYNAVEMRTYYKGTATGTMTVGKTGSDPAIGGGSPGGAGLVAPTVEVAGGGAAGLYVTAGRHAGDGVIATKALTVSAGANMEVDKLADSRTLGAGVVSGEAKVDGTLAIRVGNGANGMIDGAAATAVTVGNGGVLDIALDGTTGDGVGLWKDAVTVAAGGTLAVRQTAGADAVIVGSARTGTMAVAGKATVTRGGALTGDGIAAGQVDVTGSAAELTVENGGGRHAITTQANTAGTVSVTGGAKLAVDSNGTASQASAGDGIRTHTLTVTDAGTKLAMQMSQSEGDGHVIYATDSVTFAEGTGVSIGQQAGSHTIFVEGTATTCKVYTYGDTQIEKNGTAGGNVIRAVAVNIGRYGVTNNTSVLKVVQGSGSDTFFLTGNTTSNRMDTYGGALLDVHKLDNATDAVFAGDKPIICGNNAANLTVLQESGGPTATIHRWLYGGTNITSVRRLVADTNPIFHFDSGSTNGTLSLSAMTYGYFENAGGGVLTATGKVQSSFGLNAANFKRAGNDEWVWNNNQCAYFYFWMESNGSAMTSINWSSSSSVLSEDHHGVGPNMPALDTTTMDLTATDFEYLRVGRFGLITIDQPYKGDTQVTGTMPSGVTAGYAWEYDVPQDGVMNVRQGPSSNIAVGSYAITLGQPLSMNRSNVYVLAKDARDLKAYEYKPVAGRITMTVDPDLSFRDADIGNTGTVRREAAQTGWTVTVDDTRGYMDAATGWQGVPWTVMLRVDGPFVNTANPLDALAGSYMFVREGASGTPVTTSDTAYYSAAAGMPSDTTQMHIAYGEDEGLLFHQDAADGAVDTTYQTTMIWTLVF